MNVAVYGGSFDPPHVAHVLAAAYLLSCSDVERVLVVPVFDHALDKELTPFEERVAMCELAFGSMNGVEVSRVEETLGTPSYTLRMLEKLAAERPAERLRLVVGADVLFERHKWHAFDRIAAAFDPIVLGRVGFEHPEAPRPVLPDVSSTRIRALLGKARTAEEERELEDVVPRRVLRHIRERGLYPCAS